MTVAANEFAATFALAGYEQETVPVRIVPNSANWYGASPQVVLDPVEVELRQPPPPPPPPPKKVAKKTKAAAASPTKPAPSVAPPVVSARPPFEPRRGAFN